MSLQSTLKTVFYKPLYQNGIIYVKALLGAYNRPLQINDFNHKYYIHNYSLIRIFTDYNCRYSQGMEKHARMKVKMVMPIMIHLKPCNHTQVYLE